MNSIDFRRDKRTVEQFSKNIEDYTEREMIWGIILRIQYNEKGKKCSIEEYGVDNSGGLIEGRLPNYNVDKIFNFLDGTKEFIEIKTIPEYLKKFFTFKASSLKNCFKNNASIVVPRSQGYYKIPPNICEYLYKNYPHKIYERFSTNDPAVRIYAPDIKNLISQGKIIKEYWTNKAKFAIVKNHHKLFRDKE